MTPVTTPPPAADSAPLPLSGLRVLELASVLAGPQVGQFLAELGAEVLKIEAPAGDVTRTWRTAAEAPDTTVSAYFSCANWGKRSQIIDLATPAGRAEVHRLAASADLILASYKPGDAEKLQVDYATLSALNPRLIYGHITGYGPEAHRAGYDAVLQAETGFMHLNAPGPGQEPQKMPVALIDLLTAHQLKEGLLTALYQRERTGRGALVQVSLWDSALASLANQAATYLVTGHDPQPLGSGHPSIVPYGTVYTAQDGVRLLLAVGADRQFQQLCAVLERPEWATDARFHTNTSRVAHRATLEEMLRQRIAQVPGAALLAELERRLVPAGAVRTVEEALRHPAAAAMLLPATPEFAHPGLRTVAFRSNAWPVAAHLLPPPALDGAPE
ncbi:crotonobetainyl-CoA:carnitine CoA-transferase CaiB-like acyl-CoA transferase [Hymenobacter luteus]|uniref:Crotonobetainyl-CoA:carnitine CoA-transferase CaiB-like acyl-CoA transferase n=2 Tax=Hymenobacter TaxID=89966 RepID=A0A7W9T4D4_9BACT|nr:MULTISPECIES: CoA transferase [Hymenobacter]MBB4602961.1 crotonobetainyl-CoA:carnitine CoA-transferase CaiB-like acyl-CoA transferase [Hymenobacter latericoloratus]MBB6060853.1 crotonobetainyl-CoA:carnitine CoA-transferase CaiB-like acyl-CoA transferase [Hymenobacter luteus]